MSSSTSISYAEGVKAFRLLDSNKTCSPQAGLQYLSASVDPISDVDRRSRLTVIISRWPDLTEVGRQTPGYLDDECVQRMAYILGTDLGLISRVNAERESEITTVSVYATCV